MIKFEIEQKTRSNIRGEISEEGILYIMDAYDCVGVEKDTIHQFITDLIELTGYTVEDREVLPIPPSNCMNKLAWNLWRNRAFE